MKEALNRLQSISDKLDALSQGMKEEAALWKEELKERELLGITDVEEAYKHYIEFMKAHGYDYERNDKDK